jgi:hypothetical protein
VVDGGSVESRARAEPSSVSTGSPEASRARFRGGIAKCGDRRKRRRATT